MTKIFEPLKPDFFAKERRPRESFLKREKVANSKINKWNDLVQTILDKLFLPVIQCLEMRLFYICQF